jgi:serine/threonine-protein kinase HipA
MSPAASVELEVHSETIDGTVHAGTAFVSLRRGAVTTTFEYDTRYLGRHDAYEISPDLPITSGGGVTNGLPGALADSAPDRWGRNLIKKRQLADARANHGSPPTVTEVDYLLGVDDLTRQGALRYRVGASAFLADNHEVPRLVALPRLLDAADIVSREDLQRDDMAAVKVLLDAGSGSLGGARPKASIQEGDQLFIAKFPHSSDEWDLMAWEMTALDLAEAAGISTPRRRLIDVTGRRVLMLERFDRDGPRRRPFISAMSLVQSEDGETRDYVEISEALTDHGSNVRQDLVELWRRMAFSVAINNTDDHLRNHGFLRRGSGWSLSPIFDVNPNPDLAAHRTTSINFATDRNGARDGLVEVSASFGLSKDRAASIWAQVRAGVANWKDVAHAHGIGTGEIRRFAPIFGEMNVR